MARFLSAARIGFDAERIREWALFGVFCGLALGTKYTRLFAVPALAVCCAFVVVNRGELNRTIGIRNLCVGLAIAAAVASPFYLPNWILLGCPIYPPPPGYSPFCSPKYFPPQAIEQFHNYIYRRGAGLGHDWLDFLKLPFNLTYHATNFRGAGGIGLCPLGLAPFGIIAMRENTFARSLALFALLVTCMWFLQQESRFLIHAYVVAAIFSVAGWNCVSTRSGRLQRLAATTVVGTSTHVVDVVSPVSGFQIERPPSNVELVFQSTGQRIYRVRLRLPESRSHYAIAIPS